jgi:hypothetical protein
MEPALASAEKHRLAKRRDIVDLAFAERMGDRTTNPRPEYGVRLAQGVYM